MVEWIFHGESRRGETLILHDNGIRRYELYKFYNRHRESNVPARKNIRNMSIPIVQWRVGNQAPESRFVCLSSVYELGLRNSPVTRLCLKAFKLVKPTSPDGIE